MFWEDGIMHLCQTCHWDPFSACAYCGNVSDDEKAPLVDLHLCQNAQGLMPLGTLLNLGSWRVDKAPILDLHLCQNLRASCHWDSSSACPYGGTASDDEKAPIPDPASLPDMPLEALVSMPLLR